MVLNKIAVNSIRRRVRFAPKVYGGAGCFLLPAHPAPTSAAPRPARL